MLIQKNNLLDKVTQVYVNKNDSKGKSSIVALRIPVDENGKQIKQPSKNEGSINREDVELLTNEYHARKDENTLKVQKNYFNDYDIKLKGDSISQLEISKHSLSQQRNISVGKSYDVISYNGVSRMSTIFENAFDNQCDDKCIIEDEFLKKLDAYSHNKKDIQCEDSNMSLYKLFNEESDISNVSIKC
mmetsp:Transcript_23888/g.24116  ORF Transcript_23888/g.24116 Transcript_23888/m.24116 type:complete len:188 (+) Transcript_23888:177-740(+)